SGCGGTARKRSPTSRARRAASHRNPAPAGFFVARSVRFVVCFNRVNLRLSAASDFSRFGGAMDFTLTEEHLRWRAVARDFAESVIKPDVLRRDRIPAAAERIPWDWIREADRLGLRTLGVSKAWGGAGADVLTMCLAGEELAVGDLGFAVIMDQCWKMAHILSDAMTPDQQRKFIPPFVADPEATLAIAFTEAGAGSDHQGYYDAPDIDFRTTAVRDGDAYVINGTKRFVSNGCMAKLYFVIARTDSSRSLREGGSVFIVPSDAPGFRPGFFH